MEDLFNDNLRIACVDDDDMDEAEDQSYKLVEP
jgi:hypothetical protein